MLLVSAFFISFAANKVLAQESKVLPETFLQNARTFAGSGAYDSAFSVLEQGVHYFGDKKERVYPILIARARLLTEVEKYDEARRELDKLKESYLKPLQKAEILCVSATLNDLVYRYEDSYREYREALSIRQRQNFSDTMALAKHYHNLGTVMLNLDLNYRKALKYLKISGHLFSKGLGNTHPHVIMTSAKIGSLFKQLAYFDSAEVYTLDALRKAEASLGRMHPLTNMIYRELSDLFMVKQQYAKALIYLSRGRNVIVEISKNHHPDIALYDARIGRVYMETGDHKKAKEYFEASLERNLQNFGDSSAEAANDYRDIGQALSGMGKNKEAVELYKRALRKIENLRTVTDQSRDRASLYNSIANALTVLEDSSAFAYYEKALREFSDIEKGGYFKALTINAFALSLQAFGQYDKADYYFKASLRELGGEEILSKPDAKALLKVNEKNRLLFLMSGYAEFLAQRKDFEYLIKICETGSRLSALCLQESPEEDDKLFLMSESVSLYAAGALAHFKLGSSD